ncbi:carbamoyltransferase HypF [Shewanella eurypsychrophilus]|uniref:Carbamoyltransferase HypF n=1 Tax=Shewanella eurypsychrophilus TaxID=2593656 RepID=A0ABX6V6B2_9GAMM|nr:MULTISPECIES: carbamoyltransferase HypF [Shewanella]QFU22244.1 carbamoyltransferase HypF [Shewanella sp. YLB-09]QPG57530.1 carbamoyltransferase HypF [Shewanella eurypsychrophilus]
MVNDQKQSVNTQNSDIQRVRLFINGIVQGVGFRPFVYRYALQNKLTGTVLNDSQGVTIELQGLENQLTSFISQLKNSPPPLARIDLFEELYIPVNPNCSEFKIIESQQQSQAIVIVPTDKSSCSECNNEVLDPSNRHYQYPFTNCTNCGPRYTLIKALPYDRKQTSMGSFTMCKTCGVSYKDPLDRRYHAQPVSCPECGPQLVLTLQDGQALAHKEQALTECIERLESGEILAIKGLGGFHLVCDAANTDAVAKLRVRKNRPAKPFAVMVPSIEMAKMLVTGCEEEWQLLQSQERPITLMNKRLDNNTLICERVAPDIDKLGLFLPYTPLHQLLLSRLNRPIVATSANRSGEPIITCAKEIQSQLNGVVDAILDHNREIINACDDSVVQVIGKETQVLRLARGYAPMSLPLKQTLPETVLAVGAQQKNTIAFGFNRSLFISPHIGDLFSLEAESYFESTIDTFKALYQLAPQTLVHDMHPDYAASRWCHRYQVRHPNTKRIDIQHHFAHVLSVMAANRYTKPVLGFSFDGTGLGDDGNLWGSEAMIASPKGYEPLAQLAPFKLIGGEQAIKDPRRVLLALLLMQYDLEQITAMQLPALEKLSTVQLTNLTKLWQSPNHGLKTSSAGRLFDGVAAALGLIETTQFEGQAGMLIETAANRLTSTPELFTLTLVDKQWQSGELMAQIVKAIISQPLTEQRISQISAGFLQALATAITQLADKYPDLPIVLCGGVFQNRYLNEYCQSQLQQRNHQVLSPGLVPINDGGIALGQLWYAICRGGQ